MNKCENEVVKSEVWECKERSSRLVQVQWKVGLVMGESLMAEEKVEIKVTAGRDDSWFKGTETGENLRNPGTEKALYAQSQNRKWN